jgi:hypothetical protein
LALIQSTGSPGTIKLSASAPTLSSAEIVVNAGA